MNKVKALEESRNDIKNDKGFQKNNWGRGLLVLLLAVAMSLDRVLGQVRNQCMESSLNKLRSIHKVKGMIITNPRNVCSVWEHILSRSVNGLLVRVLHVVRLDTE